MDKPKKNKYYLVYTLLFIMILPVIFYSFYANNKSLIWNSDGIRQHYIALMYFGKWGRKILNYIFVKHQFCIPLWDSHIGYGSDIITTMHYYVIGDPLNLLSIFIPENYTEYLYQVLIIIRFYLAGISFLFYCRLMKRNQIAAISASFNYVFCGYMLYAGVRHPFFINPMINLPLILAGAEQIMRKGKATLFVGMVCLSAISNFYFFYMIVFAVCFYVAVRFFTIQHTNMAKEMIFTIWRFTFYSLTGVSMSAVILLPVLIQFFCTKRSGTSQLYPVFYGANYYISLLSGFITAKSIGDWTILGFTIPALLCIFVLFAFKRKYLFLKIPFCIMTVMLCIPFCGKALNGFSYVSNRWCFIYAALVSYIMAVVWEEILLIFCKIFSGFPIRQKIIQFISLCFLCLTIFCTCANAFYLYGEKGINYAHEFISFGKAFEKIQISPPKALQYSKGEQDSFFRYETDDFKNMNVSTVFGEHGLGYYWSLENSIIPEYFLDMSVKSFHVFNYKDLDHRTFLDALASVRYFVGRNSNVLPYGYEYIRSVSLSEKMEYKIYENQYALPLGYTYSSYIPYEKYLQFDSAARQEALLQGIVIDPENDTFPENQYSETKLKFLSKSVHYTPVYGENIIAQEDGSLKTTEESAQITLHFKGFKNCETYLFLENVNISTEQPFDNDLIIKVNSNDAENQMRHITPTHRYYKAQKNYLINLGYQENAQTNITITLPSKGVYQFGSMKIICQPMEAYAQQTADLTKDIMENEKINANTIEGTIDLNENKILCLSVPYSKGWHAWVDGKKTTLYKANGMFMALALTKGNHKIKLCYQTPGLFAGTCLSFFGCVLFLVTIRADLRVYCSEHTNKKGPDHPASRR